MTAVLFYPVFYGRLGLRAIMLPVFSGLSAYFWWRGWDFQRKGAKGQRSQRKSVGAFVAAGTLAGLSLYTYMAARAVPIFYGLFAAYLALFHWRDFKRRWRGAALFALAFALVAAPLAWYLLTHPAAEFRIGELDAPLRALRAGDLRPVLENGLKILLGFGFKGDPLWRQGVAGMPLFGPLVAFLFYLSLPLCLWRWKDARYGFLLLWLGTAVTPSLVTINAPSSIRMINLLPVLGVFPALAITILIHDIPRLSTVIHHISTGKGKIGTTVLLLFGVSYACWTAWSIFVVWPQGGDVPFVWQTALRDIGNEIDDDLTIGAAAVGGWSADTMDLPTMQLFLQRDDLPLSTFGLQPGDDIIYTLIIPKTEGETAASAGSGQAVSILHPTALPLDPAWVSQLETWADSIHTNDSYTQYTLRRPPAIEPQFPAAAASTGSGQAIFGDQLELLGYDLAPGELVTYWRAAAPITQPIRLFVQVLDENGELIAEDYRWDTADPQNLWRPHWREGDLILQRHPLPGVTADAHIRIALFDPYSCAPGPCQNLFTEDGEPFLLLPVQE
jgi:hypothetical protein